MNVFTILFVGLIWWPGQPPEVYTVVTPTLPKCIALEKTFILSVEVLNPPLPFDPNRVLEPRTQTSCQPVVKPPLSDDSF